MNTLSKIFYGLLALLLVGVAGFFFVPSLPIAGGLDIKIVKSGSMEPGIMTGGIVVIHKSAAYVPGDIITFQSQGADIPTTHRIVSAEEVDGTKMFTTKGDANEDADTNPASLDSIIGKVLFTVPYFGYVLDFSRQPLGFAILIGLPALLIVIDEIEKIWKELHRKREPKTVREMPETLVVTPFVPVRSSVRMMDIGLPVMSRTEKKDASIGRTQAHKKLNSVESSWVVATAGVLILVTIMVNLWSIKGTVSYFNDTEPSTGNTLRAGALDFTAIPKDGTVFTFVDGVLDNPDGLVTLVAPEPGSDPLTYAVSIEFISGNISFCDAISVTTNTPFSYTGSLLGLTATSVAFGGPWSLGATVVSGAYGGGDTCVIVVVYRGRHASMTEASDGYSDEERVHLTFTAPLLPVNVFEKQRIVPEAIMLENENVSPAETEPAPPPTTGDIPAENTSISTDTEVTPPLDAAPAVTTTTFPETAVEDVHMSTGASDTEIIPPTESFPPVNTDETTTASV